MPQQQLTEFQKNTARRFSNDKTGKSLLKLGRLELAQGKTLLHLPRILDAAAAMFQGGMSRSAVETIVITYTTAMIKKAEAKVKRAEAKAKASENSSDHSGPWWTADLDSQLLEFYDGITQEAAAAKLMEVVAEMGKISSFPIKNTTFAEEMSRLQSEPKLTRRKQIMEFHDTVREAMRQRLIRLDNLRKQADWDAIIEASIENLDDDEDENHNKQLKNQ